MFSRMSFALIHYAKSEQQLNDCWVTEKMMQMLLKIFVKSLKNITVLIFAKVAGKKWAILS